MIDNFINNTLWFYEIVMNNLWIGKIIWLSLSVTTIILFIYHLQSYHDLEFFIEHVDVLGDFSIGSYKNFMIVFALFPVFSAFIILLSILEGLDSLKFLERFGCP